MSIGLILFRSTSCWWCHAVAAAMPWHLLASLLPRGRGVFVSRERLLFCGPVVYYGSGLLLWLCVLGACREGGEIKLISELSVGPTYVYCSSVPLINQNN